MPLSFLFHNVSRATMQLKTLKFKNFVNLLYSCIGLYKIQPKGTNKKSYKFKETIIVDQIITRNFGLPKSRETPWYKVKWFSVPPVTCTA